MTLHNIYQKTKHYNEYVSLYSFTTCLPHLHLYILKKRKNEKLNTETDSVFTESIKFDQWPIPGLGTDCMVRSRRAISLRVTRFVAWVLPLGAEGGTVAFGSEVDTIVSSRVDFNVFLDSILGVLQQIKMTYKKIKAALKQAIINYKTCTEITDLRSKRQSSWLWIWKSWYTIFS